MVAELGGSEWLVCNCLLFSAPNGRSGEVCYVEKRAMLHEQWLHEQKAARSRVSMVETGRSKRTVWISSVLTLLKVRFGEICCTTAKMLLRLRGNAASAIAEQAKGGYGSSKAMVEEVLESCAQAHGLRAIALRYFNAAGADPQRRTVAQFPYDRFSRPVRIAVGL